MVGQLDAKGETMTRRAVLLIAGLMLATPAAAHIGSPDIFFEGQAGPYPVRVMVRAPGVIPGQAEISVRIKEGTAERVTVRPVHWNAGVEGAPPADDALPVRGEEGLFTAQLWLMTSSSYSIYVDVEGADGSGTAVVPMATMASSRLEMPAWMGTLLVVLGLLLFWGAVTAVGAAVRESVLEPGVEPSLRRWRSAIIAMLSAAVVLSLAVYGGKAWWDSSDRSHEQRIFQAFEIATTVRVEPDGNRTLTLEILDEAWRARQWTPLVLDHGKLIHLFLMQEPELDAFAHIHPIRLDEDRFEVNIPPLPAGSYRVYADVTHGSGFTQTMTSVVTVPESAPDVPTRSDDLIPDPDDSWTVASAQTDGEHVFPDGRRLVRQTTGPIVVGRDVDLTFTLQRSDGTPEPIEPYMGMMSHAAVRREDGAVFVHLHPTGTISMVAQQMFREQQFQRRPPAAADGGEPGTEEPLEPMPSHEMAMHMGRVATDGTVSLPYAFPKPGPYRIWVQVKSNGQVYTGVFDLEIIDEDAPA